MAEHPRIVLLLGDISVHAFRDAFKQFPDRCFNVGVCEQAMVGAAAGWAMEGFIPIVHTIASFLVRRAYEQICVDFGMQDLPGIFVSVGAAGAYEALGPTHSCPEDLTLMQCVPGMTVFTPLNAGAVGVCLRHVVNSSELACAVGVCLHNAIRSSELAYIRL